VRDLNSMRQFSKIDNHFVNAVFVSKEYKIANRVLNEHLRVVYVSRIQIQNSYKLTSALQKSKTISKNDICGIYLCA
jgi:hypothetical protein